MIEDVVSNSYAALNLVGKYVKEYGIIHGFDMHAVASSYSPGLMIHETNILLQEAFDKIECMEPEDILKNHKVTIYLIEMLIREDPLKFKDFDEPKPPAEDNIDSNLKDVFNKLCEVLDRLYGNTTATPMVPVLKIGYKHV